ncbi:7127_t:CDS:2 [Entrophospora sp. SA101]|nr:7127_t:CDS:2 [Entrophospora sp. SA101]
MASLSSNEQPPPIKSQTDESVESDKNDQEEPVTVKDCTSGKWEQLTITNDDGRLSNDELARMIADSERYCADDERIIQRMEAHNKLEGYDKRFSSKFSPIDIERFNNTIQETITWFDDNQEAGKHEYDYKREILEKIFYPVTSICEKGFFD